MTEEQSAHQARLDAGLAKRHAPWERRIAETPPTDVEEDRARAEADTQFREAAAEAREKLKQQQLELRFNK